MEAEEVGQADIRVICSGVGLQHGLVLTTVPALTTDCNKQINQHPLFIIIILLLLPEDEEFVIRQKSSS